MHTLTDQSFLPLFGTNEFNEDVLHLSLYLPLEESRLNITKLAKSTVSEALRNHETTKDNKDLQKSLTTQITSAIEKDLNFDSGLAVFARFYKTNEAIKNIDEDFYLFSLFLKPQNSYYIGNTFDFVQLLNLYNYKPNVLVLNLGRKSCALYVRQDGRFAKLDEIKNETIYSEDKDNSPMVRGATRFGTGGRSKLERDSKRADKEFMQKVANHIAANFKNNEMEHLLVFHSTNFAEFKNKAISDLSKRTQFKKIIFINKNIKNESELIAETESVMLEELQDQRRKEIKAAQESSLFTSAWSDVVRAITEKRVGNLFVKQGTKKEGYITKNDGLTLVSESQSGIYVDNIIPWLIKSVFEAKGEVRLLTKSKFDIAASLRY